MPDSVLRPAAPPSRLERWAAGVVVVMAAIRLLVAAWAPLSSDEAYYWQWTRPLALSYFDHPPMVAYWIWAGTRLAGDTALGVRLMAVVTSLGVTALAWDTARVAFASRAAAAWTALWLNTTILFASAGVIVTPDSPLLLFWSLALWALVRLIGDGRTRWLYVTGAALGLGAVSKYTMGLLLPAIVAVFLLFPALRSWWRRAPAWGAVLLAALLLTPILVWNAQHDWASFHKQFSHAFAAGAPKNTLASFLGSQVGVTTPLIFAFLLWGMGWALVEGWRRRRADWFLFGVASLPILLFFAEHALSGTVQAHWPGPAYLGAIIATAGAFAARPHSRGWRIAFGAAPVLGGALALLVFLQAATACLPLPVKIDPLKRLGGWDTLAAAVDQERTLHPGAFLFTNKHEPTGPVAFYLRDHPPVFLEGPIRPSYYTAAQVTALRGRDGILILHSRDGGSADQAPWFHDMTFLRHVEMRWGGRPADAFDLYLCTGYKGGAFVVGGGLNGARDLPP